VQVAQFAPEVGAAASMLLLSFSCGHELVAMSAGFWSAFQSREPESR
jgi:hypothetical protein